MQPSPIDALLAQAKFCWPLALAIVAPLTVHSGRLWKEARQHQVAIDEVANQLERLTSLPGDQREVAIEQLAPSDHLVQTFPKATLRAEMIRDTDGTRIRVSLDRGDARPGGALSLVGWIDPMPSKVSQEPAEVQE